MMASRALCGSFALMCVAALAAGSAALAQPATGYAPKVGQEGKDVVWVPTPQTLVDRMLDMAKATPAGLRDRPGLRRRPHRHHGGQARHQGPRRRIQPGDGRAGQSATRKSEGVADRATFVEGDIFETDFSQATVLTLFLLTDLNIKLRPTILKMKPGTRVVSNTFMMGDWEPDDRVEAPPGCSSFCKASLWIVPAKVEGTWQMGAERTRSGAEVSGDFGPAQDRQRHCARSPTAR